MAGTPYIRFFGDDWLSGTQSLTLEERGVLITLVALTATAGEAPAYDVERLARRLGCTRAKTIKLMNALCETGKITIEDGRIYQPRALKETKKAQENSEKQTKIANARWSRLDVKTNENKPADDATALPRECQPEPEPEPEETEAKASVSAPVLVSLEQIAGKSRKPKPPQPAPDLQPALDAYNRLAERLRAEHGKAVWPVVTTFTAKRQAALRARIKEHGLEAWGTVLRKAYASPLCTGLRNSWAADFNFLTSPEGFLKTLEGNYDDRASANGSASRHSGSNGGRLEAFDRLADKLQERSDGPDAWQHDDSGAEGGDIIDIGPAQLTG